MSELERSSEDQWVPPDVFDEYRLVRRLGRGGMGEVFLAHDTLLDRLVAVKFIAAIDATPGARERFLIEARAAARLQHPNVASVYRVGELEGRPYLITEFIRGEGIDRLAKPVPWERALRLGIGLARGLAAAHRRGVLHRDIKPANAIIAEDGEVKLLDFGLAKLIDVAAGIESMPAPRTRRSAERAAALGDTVTMAVHPPAIDAPSERAPERRVTVAGVVMGTPDYMAPEIWRGEPASRRSDVYSLGAVLYELVVGRAPLRHIPFDELAHRSQEEDPESIARAAPDVDPRFAQVIERSLRREPTLRWAGADEMREALEALEPVAPGMIPEGNPYRGLMPFEAEHRGLFFGRAAEIRALVERLRAEPFVLVAGDSGVGKSSLCRAGVLPLVVEGVLGEGRAWSVTRLYPGRRPLGTLAAALAPLGHDEDELDRRIRADTTELGRTLRHALGEGRGAVLFVDQLEELITISDAEEARIVGEALGSIARGAPGIRLLATVRGDFLTRLASIPGIGDEISRAFYLLRPLPAAGIREAIVGPARAKGVAFESDALVEGLVASTAAHEGTLPLLQFALAELWEAREGTSINADAVERIGGVAGALARHADSVFYGLAPARRLAARRILTSLVTLEGTRARRTETELARDDPEAPAALDALVRGRLLVARDAEGGTAYELAHEALATEWNTLRAWLDLQAEQRTVRVRLEAAAAEWDRLSRAREALWSARQLAEASIVDEAELGPLEKAFLRASRGARARRAVLRNALVVGLPLIALLGFAWFRFERREALDERVRAQLARARAVTSEANGRRNELDGLRERAIAAFDARDLDAGNADWARAAGLEREVDRLFVRATQELEATLRLDATHAAARALLADVLLDRATIAERAGDAARLDELVERMRLYDDGGARTRRWSAPATLRVETEPRAAEISIARYQADPLGRRVLGPARPLGASPIASLELEPGSYLLELRAPDRVPVRYPVLLGRGQSETVRIALPPAAAVPPGFVYVPPGRFLVGTRLDESVRRSFFRTVPLHTAETGGYAIAIHETTFGEWIEFLRALPRPERAKRAPKLGAGGFQGAVVLTELDGGDWHLTLQPGSVEHGAPSSQPIVYAARDRRATQNWLRFPVLGITLDDATAYVAWLSASGRVPGARLCTEHEWERAARGADDREFPHGDTLLPDDANHDLTYARDPAALGPDEVGSHPNGVSPFGVADMTGNAFEWAIPSISREPGVIRGGAFYFEENTCRAHNRLELEPGTRDFSVGLRVCAEVGVR